MTYSRDNSFTIVLGRQKSRDVAKQQSPRWFSWRVYYNQE